LRDPSIDLATLAGSQEALRILSVVLDAAKDLLIVVLDREGRIVRFNRACKELTGYRGEEVRGRPISEVLLIPEEAGGVEAVIEELVAGRPNQWENHWRTKDGRRRLIAWSNSVVLGDDGAVKYVVGTGIDVTEHRQVTEQARESQATLRAVLETAAQAILATNREGRIVLVNAAAEAMFGYRRQEMLGRAVENLIPPVSVGLNPLGLRRDQTEFPVEISVSHVEGREGLLTVAFVTDITERKRAEDALRQSEAEARASQEQLRALTTGLVNAQEDERRRVSRELHDDVCQRLALLAVEVGSLQADFSEAPATVRELLRSLEKSLGAVAGDVRRTAYQLHPSVLEHLGLVAALESFCTAFSRQETLQVRFRHRRMPRAVPEGIALCLYRVAQECLHNVAKHSRAARVSITLQGTDSRLLLTIADNGQGFDLESARSKGSIGIISMEERVRATNGTLTIQSRPGEGTRIEIQVPLERGVP
jgi:PAS domain S-box-containing protein